MKSNNTHRFLLVVTLLVAVTCLNHAATKYGHGLLGYGRKHSYYTVKPEKQDTGMAKKQHSEEAKKAKKQRMVYLQGTSKDSFTKAMLQAHITVMDADSAVIDTTTAWRWDNEGGWYMQVPARAGMLIIKGECDGYETSFLNFNI
ncbi:MAG: hypothetical protein SPJ21_08055, partial [Prevotella sp.]|nr:hypothetical protein [Prevotella sp.]